MTQANKEIREYIVGSGLKFWQVADKYGLTDGNFSKKLRKELSIEDKEKIFGIIEELRAEAKGRS